MEVYNMHEIAKRKHLPDDVNIEVEKMIAMLNVPELVDKIIDIRKKRLHGTLFFYLNVYLIAEIPFKGGICPRFYLVDNVVEKYNELRKKLKEAKNLDIPIFTFKRSILNRRVSAAKTPKEKKDE